jgi:hypothetical protein
VKQLKMISDAMVVLAFGFAGIALLGPSWAWYVSAFCLVDAVAATVLKRRAVKAKKTAG